VKQKILILALIVSVGINVGALVTFGYHAWRGKRAEPNDLSVKDKDSDLLRDRLALTREQIEQMRAAQERIFTQTKPLKLRLYARRKDLLDLLKQSELDQARLDTIIGDIASMQAELELQVVKDIQRLKAMLNADQQEMFLRPLERRLLERAVRSTPQR